MPGLRREELARLAAISVDYLTRLEQGRVTASAGVLAALADALRLTADDRRYLAEVSGTTVGTPPHRPSQRPRPAMQRLLDQLTETPAMVLGRRMDILAWNIGATSLFVDFDALPIDDRNYVRLLFTNPVMRALHRDWRHDAESCVAALRTESSRFGDDPRLTALVDDLSARDDDFAGWWASHATSTATYGTKRYHHPVVGDLTLDCDMWGDSGDDGQRLMVLTAEAGTASADSLRLLASWSATATRR